MSERSWFLASDGRQDGPFPESDLSALIAAGRLTRDTLVWTEGMAGWQRAADVLSAAFSGRAPPPPPAMSLPGGMLPGSGGFSGGLQGGFQGGYQGGLPSGRIAADFGVWPLLGRGLLLIIGTLLVIPAPWVFTSFYRWAIEHIHVPGRPNLGFTGKVGDLWWVFVLLGLFSYAGVAHHYRYLPYLIIPIEAALNWLVIRWIVANITSDGRPLALNFGGSVWGYIGWTLFLDVSVISIIGWAWVETAWMRWIARNIEGTTPPVSFHASGWDILWRTIVLVLACAFIIPIPWMLRWYACWFISQFAVGEKSF